MTALHTIRFGPQGITTSAADGDNLLRVAQSVGVDLDAYCGGGGTCGKCRVRIVSGAVPEATTSEHTIFSAKERLDGWRLACGLLIRDDLVVETITAGKPVILLEGEIGSVVLQPAVRLFRLQLPVPALGDILDDLDRLRAALAAHEVQSAEAEIDFAVLRELPSVLRQSNWQVAVVVLDTTAGDSSSSTARIIQVKPVSAARLLGLAIDIGTTTIAAYLHDLEDGSLLKSNSMLNPQIRYGDDVLSRLSQCEVEGAGLAELRQIILDGLNRLIAEMAVAAGISAEDIAETVIVMNTVMHHIISGIEPHWLGQAPYVQAARQALDISAADFGLDILPTGNVHLLPLISGFIGADTTAALVAEYPFAEDQAGLLIDIGTNSEICLAMGDELAVTSCATGPALEGAQIRDGVRAADGAIEKVGIDPVSLEPTLAIIGNLEVPIGICGSGIIDAVAAMAEVGIINASGAFNKTLDLPRVHKTAAGWEYLLYHDEQRSIAVTQKDVRAVQLAKAALYAGAKELLKRYAIKKIDKIVLAGAFGSYLDKQSALNLGLIPDCRLEGITAVGNAAGSGARLTLLNTNQRRVAAKLARQAVYVETALSPGYQQSFTQAMAIPHAVDAFTANQSYIWPCSAEDYHQHREGDYLTWGTPQIEILAWVGQEPLWSEGQATDPYPYQHLAQIASGVDILACEAIQQTLANIQQTAQDGTLQVVETSGPFALLATLIDPIKVYTNRDLPALAAKTMELAEALASYTKAALAAGARVISVADAQGATELVGPAFFAKVSGPALMAYLRAVQPFLSQGIVHLCGKTSYSLLAAGLATSRVERVAAGQDYIAVLAELALHKGFDFAGNSCLHQTSLAEPIVYRLELAPEAVL